MGGRNWIAATALAALALLTAPPVSAQNSVDAPQYITYTEEVPCPPTNVAVPVRRATTSHRRRVRSVPVKRANRAIVAARHRPVRHVVRPHPAVKTQKTRLIRHAARRPRLLLHASDPAQSKRCTVVRRDRLTAASFGITPETAVLTPIKDEIQLLRPTLIQVSPSSGRAAFGDPINPAAGGGYTLTGSSVSVPIASAAPEPATWTLMLGGVGLAGLALRRRPRLLRAVR